MTFWPTFLSFLCCRHAMTMFSRFPWLSKVSHGSWKSATTRGFVQTFLSFWPASTRCFLEFPLQAKCRTVIGESAMERRIGHVFWVSLVYRYALARFPWLSLAYRWIGSRFLGEAPACEVFATFFWACGLHVSFDEVSLSFAGKFARFSEKVLGQVFLSFL